MFEVIRYFTDLQDDNYAYNEGDTYPRKGLSPSQERIKELASSENKQGTPLIKAIEAAVPVEAEEETPAEDKPKAKRKRKE